MAKSAATRECLITTGATAPFPGLIKAALQNLDTFKELGYTKLNFQAGDGLSYFHEIKPDNFHGIDVEAFAFADSLYSQMRRLQTHVDARGIVERKEGLVITHAGSGTILDAMRLGLPLVVVPNTSLLDNHQQELADELQEQCYATKSDCDGLKEALKLADEKAKAEANKLQTFQANAKNVALSSEPAVLGEKQRFKEVMDATVGYDEDPNARLD